MFLLRFSRLMAKDDHTFTITKGWEKPGTWFGLSLTWPDDLHFLVRVTALVQRLLHQAVVGLLVLLPLLIQYTNPTQEYILNMIW